MNGIEIVKKATPESQEIKPPSDYRLFFLILCIVACLVEGIALAIVNVDTGRLYRRIDAAEREVESLRKALHFETDIETAQAQIIKEAIKEVIKK